MKKKRIDTLLTVSVAVISVVVIAYSLFLYHHRPHPPLPPYTVDTSSPDTSVSFWEIVQDKKRTTHSPTSNTCSACNKVHFRILGLSTCPHCTRMKKFLIEHYGGESVDYLEASTKQEQFKNLYLSTGISGVPVTAIYWNQRLVAVVEGERELTSDVVTKIARTADRDSSIIIFVRDKAIGIPYQSTKADTIRKVFE